MLNDAQLARIRSVASPALGDGRPGGRVEGECRSELQVLLRARNGFFAFDSALHVFPSVRSGQAATGMQMSAEIWNEPSTWKATFDGMADGLWCFAEDIFGVQFAVRDEGVVSFDPETGDTRDVADDVGGWIDAVMSDYRQLTGYPLAHEWKRVHGALAPSRRLLPKIPFVLGGAFEISNLFDGDAVEGMKARGHVAVQIRDLPDGSAIEYVPVP